MSQEYFLEIYWPSVYARGWPSACASTISEGEDILWVSRMLGHKNSDITLKSYAKAYNISRDKDSQKERALFLNKGHSMGTLNNVTYEEALKIGAN